MTEADILHWIRDTSLGVAVRQSRWMFATGETLHFLGLSLLVGGILIEHPQRRRPHAHAKAFRQPDFVPYWPLLEDETRPRTNLGAIASNNSYVGTPFARALSADRSHCGGGAPIQQVAIGNPAH